MILNIYDDNDKIVKTYKKDAYNIRYGIVEDVANTVNLDELAGLNDAELVKTMIAVVMNNLSIVKRLLMQVFPEITEDELRNATVVEMAQCIIDLIKFTMGQLQLFEKN